MMQVEQIQKATEQIRQHIIEFEIEDAILKLNELTKKIGGDYWDEALTISSNQNKLDSQIRSGLVTENEAEVAQNKLIDQILELSRSLEKDGGKITIKEETHQKTVTVTVEHSKGRRNFKWTWLAFLFIPIAMWLGYKALSKEISNPEQPIIDKKEQVITPIKDEQVKNTTREQANTPTVDACTQLMAEGKQAYHNKNVDLATAYFKKASKICESDYEPLNWLDMTYRLDEKIKKSLEQNGHTRPTEDSKENDALFSKLTQEGKSLFEAKEYEKSYATFQKALSIKDNESVKGYIRKLKEALYNKYRILGMDAYNAGNKTKALPYFKRAQTYKDVIQIQAMIKKCSSGF